MTSKREQLLAEQERIKLELEKLGNVKSAITPLEDYTDSQKIDFFDALCRKMLLKKWKTVDLIMMIIIIGSMMSVLNLKDTDAMWKYINSLT
jgi:hypothetical protein